MTQSAGSLLCPRCHLPLHAGRAAGESLFGCGACGGIWLDAHGAERLTQALHADALALADSAAQHAAHEVDTAASNLSCPVCQQPLRRRLVERANVELDDCASHGTWFDRNELQTVARTLVAARAYGGGGAPAAAPAKPNATKPQHASVDHDDALEAATEVATYAAIATVDGESVAAGAEIAAEAGGGLLEGAFSLLGGLFDALD